MEPFEIEIHEIRKTSIYIHKIKLTTIWQLHNSCQLLNVLLEQCEEYLSKNSHNLLNINRKFIFATSTHKEVIWQNPKFIVSNSLSEFFQTIGYDPANPNIEKTLICL